MTIPAHTFGGVSDCSAHSARFHELRAKARKVRRDQFLCLSSLLSFTVGMATTPAVAIKVGLPVSAVRQRLNVLNRAGFVRRHFTSVADPILWEATSDGREAHTYLVQIGKFRDPGWGGTW